ncbi:hypothetical protein, partial [Streptomyces sp. H39-S7]|uniref:hypothetical protein n=1 Tax=Streptomyces sp. H39-S7 TaxID=3004357 RepID=UPI0022AEAB88
PTSWPPNAENAPKSAANANNAGADHDPKPPNHTRPTFLDNALDEALARNERLRDAAEHGAA